MEVVKERKEEKQENLENVEQTISLKEKIKKVVLDILQNNLIFIIGTILLVYKGLLLSYLIELEIGKDVIFYTIASSMLIMCPTINHKNKFGYIYLNVVYAIVTFIIYADFLYYTYATNFLSFYQIELESLLYFFRMLYFLLAFFVKDRHIIRLLIIFLIKELLI